MSAKTHISVLVKLRHKAAAWRRRPWAERRWFFVAVVLLGLARLAVLTVPFKRIAPWLGKDLRTAAVVPLATQHQMTSALHIGHAVRVAARYTPWESKCLPQAMAARILLGVNRLPYALFMGVKNSRESGMTAHAWVCTGAAAVIGGRSFGDFTVVGTYVSPALEPTVAR